MSDPDAQQEPAPPPQPPRPVQTTKAHTGQSQLEADELYARQLAEQYNGPAAYGQAPRSTSRERRAPRSGRSNRDTGLKPNELYDDREHSFIDGRCRTVSDLDSTEVTFQMIYLLYGTISEKDS